jgi:hypothetical protein
MAVVSRSLRTFFQHRIHPTFYSPSLRAMQGPIEGNSPTYEEWLGPEKYAQLTQSVVDYIDEVYGGQCLDSSPSEGHHLLVGQW